MPKSFEYKQAKEQVNYFKKLIYDLNKGINFKLSCLNELQLQINNLLNCGYFSKCVEQGLLEKELNLDESNLKVFISDIYYFFEATNFSKICLCSKPLTNKKSYFIVIFRFKCSILVFFVEEKEVCNRRGL